MNQIQVMYDQCPIMDNQSLTMEKDQNLIIQDQNFIYTVETFLALLSYFYIYYWRKPQNNPKKEKESSSKHKIKKACKKSKSIHGRLIPMAYINSLIKKNLVIFVKQENKKRSASHERYEKYKKATSVKEYMELNDKKYAKKDLQWDLTHSLVRIDDEKEMELVALMIQKCKEKEEKEE
mgnify:CR=1 FL=1|tara:strand:+ start:134 stop:670 length:537 start_codon:yes stop_codon:yes gene_type:complete